MYQLEVLDQTFLEVLTVETIALLTGYRVCSVIMIGDFSRLMIE